MANLGTIAVDATPGVRAVVYPYSIAPLVASTLGAVRTGKLITLNTGGSCESNLLVGISRLDTDGNPAAPCLYFDRQQQFPVCWPVVAGVTNSFSVRVKQPIAGTLRPRIFVKANPAIGINSEVEAVAPAGSGWNTVTLSVIPSSAGVLYLRLDNRSDALDQRCYWDDLSVSPGAPVGSLSYWSDGAPVFCFGGSGTSVAGESSVVFVI